MKIQLTATVEGGKVKWNHPALAVNAFKQFEGKRVTITVEKWKRKRSYLQNAYYHGVVIELLYAQFKDFGEHVDRETVHEMLKAKFLPRELIGTGGEIIGTYSGSTASLSTVEFIEYVERIQQWAAETFGLVIPDPNEDLIHNTTQQ